MIQDEIQDTNNTFIGMTVSIGNAAKILSVSASTIKRHEAEWGLHTFWDRRGRRYLIQDLEALRMGAPLPTPTAQDTEGMDDYLLGCRFRIYGTGLNKGYLGFFACQEYDELKDWLSQNFGAGTYYLKLLDEGNRMTGRNYTIEIEDPHDEENRAKLGAARDIRMLKSLLGIRKRKLEKHIK